MPLQVPSNSNPPVFCTFLPEEGFTYQRCPVRLHWLFRDRCGHAYQSLDRRLKEDATFQGVAPLLLRASARPRLDRPVCLCQSDTPCCVCLVLFVTRRAAWLKCFMCDGETGGTQTGFSGCSGSCVQDSTCVYTCSGSVAVPAMLKCADILFPISNSNAAHILGEPHLSPHFFCLSFLFFSPSFFFGLPLSLPLTFPSHPILLSSPFFNFKMLWSQCQPGDPLPSPGTNSGTIYLFFPSTAHWKGKVP